MPSSTYPGIPLSPALMCFYACDSHLQNVPPLTRLAFIKLPGHLNLCVMVIHLPAGHRLSSTVAAVCRRQCMTASMQQCSHHSHDAATSSASFTCSCVRSLMQTRTIPVAPATIVTGSDEDRAPQPAQAQLQPCLALLTSQMHPYGAIWMSALLSLLTCGQDNEQGYHRNWKLHVPWSFERCGRLRYAPVDSKTAQNASCCAGASTGP